ncbi:MAG: hypothetical protein IPG86_13205 [Chitinophagaceae bacterium]|nr:hypothetical protein [Chitinophagaceae bacterium]
MKKTTFIVFSIFLALHSFGQSKSPKWKPWSVHRCYKGLSVSVLELGYNKEAGSYLWGIRVRNDYPVTVSLSLRLLINKEKPNGTKKIYNLGPGQIWTDGENASTATAYNSYSTLWTLEIGNVCFDGMRCGGDDDCYADCDLVNRNVNQTCEARLNHVNQTTSPSEQKEAVGKENTNEGDTYSPKGTAVWVYEGSAGDLEDFYTIIDGKIYDVHMGGWPSDFRIELLQKKDAEYQRLAPDRYVGLYKGKIYTQNNNISVATFLKNGKIRVEDCDKKGNPIPRAKGINYSIAGVLNEKSIPAAAPDFRSPIDITSKWEYETTYYIDWITISGNYIELISINAESVVIRRVARLEGISEKLVYQKIADNTFEYKSTSTIGSSRLLFLSPTRFCLYFIYKNYISIGYYNNNGQLIEKPNEVESPPVVKKAAVVIPGKAEIEKDANKMVALFCELGKWEGTQIELEMKGKTDEVVNAKVLAAEKAYEDFSTLMSEKYDPVKDKVAEEHFQKTWRAGKAKCKTPRPE